MSVTASPARATADSAAATNDRPAGNRRNSAVWDKNTRRGGGSLGITHSIPARTQRENTKFAGACLARFEPIPSAFVHTTVEWTGCLRALASSLMVLILIIGLVAFIAIRASQNAS
jgi:hypothetical protein